MKNRLALFIGMAGLLLAACADDASTSTAPFNSNIDIKATEVSTIYGLGSCTSKRDGDSVWVKQESAYYVCKDADWKKSSAAPQSSSGSQAAFSDDIDYGTLKDDRDGQEYKTVKIGKQNWLAQNLNYMNDSIYSGCIPDSLGGCEKYGRAYIWHSAMELVYYSKNSTTPPKELEDFIEKPHRGVCPKGWHIPDDSEWLELFNYVEENNGNEFAGTSLKSNTWEPVPGLPQGTNRFGFSAIQAGDFHSRGYGDFKDPQDIIEQAELHSRPVPNYFRPYAGGVSYNSEGVRIDVVRGYAIFCSSTGTMWTLEGDEFYNKFSNCSYNNFDACRTGCSVRCVEDK